MYSRDVRFANKEEETFPENRLEERSNNLSDVKLFKHLGTIPWKKLELRSNSWSLFNWHKPTKENKTCR